jgi:hypothetical protein
MLFMLDPGSESGVTKVDFVDLVDDPLPLEKRGRAGLFRSF